MKTLSFYPKQASTVAHHVDYITLGLLILSTLIILLVFGLILFFSIRYRKGTPYSREIKMTGSRKLEWGWTFLTFFAFLGLFVWAAVIFFNMHVPPSGAAEIMVVGKQWMWKFQHPDGKREINELHIPVGEPILLVMTSQDVIHSFFVPDFRIKQDVLPGRYSRIWFQATRPGEYYLFCTQYCGTMHAGMRGKVIAMQPKDYQLWLQTGISATSLTGEPMSMASRGSLLFTRLGCISCHGVNPGVKAPSLYGLFGKTVSLSDGTQVIADENYIRESILYPEAKIVQGYPPIMSSFQGVVSEEDLLDLIAYIKALGGTPAPSAGTSHEPKEFMQNKPLPSTPYYKDSP